MNYSDLIPTTISKEGAYLFDFCCNCKCETRHFVVMGGVNTIRHTVKFASICYECFDKCMDFNELSTKIDLGEKHEVFWTTYIFGTSHWNEWVLNSKVPKNKQPLDSPLLPKEDFYR